VSPSDDNNHSQEFPIEKTIYLYPSEDVSVSNVEPTRIYNWNYLMLSLSSTGIESWILLKYFPRLNNVRIEDIISVKLNISDYNANQANDDNILYFNIYKCTMGWFEDKTYWNHRPSLNTERIAFGSISGSDYNIQISLPNSLLLSGELSVYGIAIVPNDVYDMNAEQTGTTPHSIKSMPSKELDNKGLYLEVKYLDHQ